MTHGNEQIPGNGGQEIDALRQEVQRQTIEQVKQEIISLSTKAAEVKRLVDSGVVQGFEGNVSDKDSAKGKAVDVKKSVVKALIAAKQPGKMLTPEGKPQAVTNLATTILRKMSDHIKPSDVTEQTAPYLYQIVNKAISGEIANIDSLVQEFDQLKHLKLFSPVLYDNLSKALVEVAKDQGISDEDAKNKFKEESDEQSEENKRNIEKLHAGRGAWDILSQYLDDSDKELVEAIYEPQKFANYLKTQKERFIQEWRTRNPNGSLDKIDELFSSKLEADFIELWGKFYTKIDREEPQEFFDNIVQQDLYKGILTATNELKAQFEKLRRYAEGHNEDFADIRLFQKLEEKTDIIEVFPGAGNTKTETRLHAYPKAKQVKASGFVSYIDLLISHYINARKYTHDANAVFHHPADHEKGFYSSLAQYAERLTTVDLDEMHLLPDAHIFGTALRLYDKILEERFAAQDWKNNETMFSRLYGLRYTELEQEVFDKLKLIFNNENISEARLRSALSMAIGASRGIFMNEVEKVAFAEPPLNKDGKATFTSYYFQDAAALTPFNPMHFFYRWQTHGSLSPVLFLPVEALKKGAGAWDHRVLWQKMQQYRDSFIQGRKNLGGELLFADILNNIGAVGGPLKRKGWRTEYQLAQLYIRDKDTQGKESINYLETWKQLQNIGYEVLFDFTNKRIEDDFLGKKQNRDKRNSFLKYLFKQYFGQDESAFDGYFSSLTDEAKANVKKQIRDNKISPTNVNDQIEIEKSRIFLFRTLSRVVAQRIPTKFLRIDRDRFSDDGKSRWKKIRETMGLSPNDFNSLMNDLLLAETLLRKEVSDEMRRVMREDNNKDLYQIEVDYKLTEERIRALLKNRLDEGRTNQVIGLYKQIQGRYSNNETFLDDFSKYIRKEEYKYTFALDDTDTSFIPFRAGGLRVLPRAIGDIAAQEQALIKGIMQFPELLHQVAINGKHDFSEIIKTIGSAKTVLENTIGADYGHQIAHHLAAVAISYFKKDTYAKALFGVLSSGRKNSLAAERAGRSAIVWEWDSREIDAFCVALESHTILPKDPYDTSKSKIEYEPIYMKVPFTKNMVKLPEKIFKQRKKDFHWNSANLKKEFGGDWKSKVFDIMNRYLPIVILFLLFKFLKDALDEAQGKKK